VRASVVIPTYNRLRDLQRVIVAIEEQAGQLRAGVEIVVVDDGSNDGTWEWLSPRAAVPEFTVLRQSNSGPAAARNRGVETAVGEIVLFLGDDTVPQSGWLAAHLEEHRLFGSRGPMATLGYTSFPPDTESPFRRFINEYGAQFGYSIIEDPTQVPFNFFYTSNISLPRVILERLGGFLEDFPSAAWEDIEFAYRAVREGLRLRYQPRARTLHYHSVKPTADILSPTEDIGALGGDLCRSAPGARRFPGIAAREKETSAATPSKTVIGRVYRVRRTFWGRCAWEDLQDFPG